MDNSDGKDTMSQAQHIWTMLEDMAQSDPAAYRKFIDKHIKEGEEYMKPPQPHMCVQVSSSDRKTDTKTLLYLNICKWPRVSAPKNQTDPIPICGGSLYTIKENQAERTQAIAIAFNPEVLDQCSSGAGYQEEQHLLINLCIDFVEKTYKLKVNRSYTVLPNKTTHKGSHDQLKKSLSSVTKDSDERIESELADVLGPTLKGTLLDQISNITLSDVQSAKNESSFRSPTEGVKILSSEKESATKSLIEELDPSPGKACGLPEPAYSLTVKEADERGDRRLLLRVQLPDVTSMAECELDISTDDVQLVVAGRYNLTLKFPEPIDSDRASAKWSSRKGTLSVSLPTTQST